MTWNPHFGGNTVNVNTEINNNLPYVPMKPFNIILHGAAPCSVIKRTCHLEFNLRAEEE